jgi:hypothetical protein
MLEMIFAGIVWEWVHYCVCTSKGEQVVRRLMRESSLTRKELSAFEEKIVGVPK